MKRLACCCLLLGMSMHLAAENVVRYRDHGAVGNGKADDFEALAKAHDDANRRGLPVKADDGATYYIGGAKRTIFIQTDTDFGSARFIIDDTALENHRANVFEVRSALKPIQLKEIKSLKKNQRQIPVKLPQACLVMVRNDAVKHFIRRGLNVNNGSSQTDVFLVDPNGQVDPNTPIIWEFDQIAHIEALPLDARPLALTGGKFTTIANKSDGTSYHARGISIRRSNVVVDGLEHRIEGEGELGAPYSGFISISQSANVVVKNSTFTGHKTYKKIGAAKKPVPMGSYDLKADSSVNVSFVNCRQTNDIMDSKYWGIMGSNFCKNLTYDGCALSRFDAHQGVTNATIRNSTLGYMGIRLTGFGKFHVENTTVQSSSFIHLREDYGSTWQGEIMIRKCKLVPGKGRSTPCILNGSNDGQHDFGYTCHMPDRIMIDTLHIADSAQSKEGPAIFADFNSASKKSSDSQKSPYVITREVIHRGVTTASGKPLRVSNNDFMFKDVKVRDMTGG